MTRYLATLFAAMLLAGCQSKSSKSTDDAHTFTPPQKGTAAQQTKSGDQTNKPLDSPAVTVNNESSPQSDRGSSDAVKGQAVMNPGAPVANQPKANPPAASPH